MAACTTKRLNIQATRFYIGAWAHSYFSEDEKKEVAAVQQCHVKGHALS
jgi:hypothetical protein